MKQSPQSPDGDSPLSFRPERAKPALLVISTEESEANVAEKSCHFDRSGEILRFLDYARNDKETTMKKVAPY